jgi:hypothetical protein
MLVAIGNNQCLQHDQQVIFFQKKAEAIFIQKMHMLESRKVGGRP